VSYAQYGDLFLRVVELIDDAVIAHANTPAVFTTTEFHGAGWTRLRECVQCLAYTWLYFRRKLAIIALGCGD
jgi:hypothetical protein